MEPFSARIASPAFGAIEPLPALVPLGAMEVAGCAGGALLGRAFPGRMLAPFLAAAGATGALELRRPLLASAVLALVLAGGGLMDAAAGFTDVRAGGIEPLVLRWMPEGGREGALVDLPDLDRGTLVVALA